MRESTPSTRTIRFGGFVVNLWTGELHKNGTNVKLQEQPFKILAMLLERAGDLVTREELRRELWPDNTYVDFDHGINMGVGKIREALGGSCEEAKYIETVGRRGYRFVGPIERMPYPDSAVLPLALRTAPSFLFARRHSVGRKKELAELEAAFELRGPWSAVMRYG